jgi:hypothetical protein
MKRFFITFLVGEETNENLASPRDLTYQENYRVYPPSSPSHDLPASEGTHTHCQQHNGDQPEKES